MRNKELPEGTIAIVDPCVLDEKRLDVHAALRDLGASRMITIGKEIDLRPSPPHPQEKA